MSEPAKESPKTPKRSRRKPAMEPLGWDEIVSQPGMGGYLSFLNGPVPLPHLQASTPEVAPDPGVDSIPAIDNIPTPGSETGPAPVMGRDHHPTPGVAPTAPPAAPSGTPKPPEVHSVSAPGVVSPPAIAPISEVVTIPAGRIRIRKCSAAQDGHSLGEEVLYQALWKTATPESDDTRTIVIGWRGMSQLCRMTPKNCKINTQRLIRKLALEVLSPYNTPESIGTTYRVHSSEAILRRRRTAGLEWVVRSRGVEFVDPATGTPATAHLCGYVSD